MEPLTTSEIYVSPLFDNIIRNIPASATSGHNFNLDINLFAMHTYTCDENIIEEFNFGTRCACKYESLSEETINRLLLGTDFPYSIEGIKWDLTDKILENKDDLIKHILEFARRVENATPPFKDDDTVYIKLFFVKPVSVSPQEFELTKARILAKERECWAEILWEEVYDKIKRLGQGSSLYEEFQWIEYYVEELVIRGTSKWRNRCFDENYERELIVSLIEKARREFKSLPAVRSIIRFLQKVNVPNGHDLTEICSICMERYLPNSEVYSMPCRHTFHFDCIETWLLKNPSCPMCRYKLPPILELN